jgi:hypothetical protein
MNYPNIVSVAISGKRRFLLDHGIVDGVNLRQAMQAGRFSPVEALAIVEDCDASMRTARESCIAISSLPTFYSTRGHVKIADFGIAGGRKGGCHADGNRRGFRHNRVWPRNNWRSLTSITAPTSILGESSSMKYHWRLPIG